MPPKYLIGKLEKEQKLMGNGYWQKILWVDLTSKKTHIEKIEEGILKKYIGGAGLGAWVLQKNLPGKTDAYSPKNLLIFATGPFQGPAVAGGAKFSIISNSPITGTFADTAGGADWGPSFKDCGYDALVIKGRADKPVYLYINNDKIEIKDASTLWGKDTYQTDDTIKEQLGDKKVAIACIGPAGERKVAIACVAMDKHSFAGRAGLGAVMGGKNLKAIAVRGTKVVPVSNPEKTKELIKRFQLEIHKAVKENKFRDHGTPMLCETAEGLGDMPIKYWDGDVWPEGAKKLGAPNYTNVLGAKPWPCSYCPVGCHRKIKITEPKDYVYEGVGPEYETLGMMGSNLLIDDPKVVAMGNDIANRLGLDTISLGAMVGFAMDCFERGLITKKETGGLEIKFGSVKAFLTLCELIGKREGFGAIFAEGTLGAAKKIGKNSVENVVHCKGLDFPAHDARSCISLAPTYATGTRGACHFRGPCEDVEMGGFFMPEVGISQGIVKFFELQNQSLVAIKCQDLGGIVNSLVLCMFMVDGGSWSLTNLAEMFNAITGWGYSVDDLMLAGERIFNLQRLLNIRDGYDAKTDVLPKKMFNPAKQGFRAGKVIPFKELMEDYYKIRGWDSSGSPAKETLERLGLA
jgi:aldehyde:ferredoxin oxidoreductase